MQAYLDHNASAPLLEAAKNAMLEALQCDGNPSSIHIAGRVARKLIEDARKTLADVTGVAPKQVVFTSGATEAAQHALSTTLRIGSKRTSLAHLYISSIEHPCILAGGRFAADKITKFGVTREGVVDLAELENVLQLHDQTKGAPLVAVMLANNETGVIQPIAAIAELVRLYNGYLCVDAVQAFGKINVDFTALGAHFVILSAHKIGGPKGAGALLMMEEGVSPLPLIHGGGQENLHRAGTQNTAAIAGFGAAIREVYTSIDKRSNITRMRDDIETGLEEISRQSSNNTPLPIFFGNESIRLDNTSCFAVNGVKAESALIALDLAGICVSSGSACASGRVNQSHVLSAMGIDPDVAECALRISIGMQTTNDQAGHFLNSWKSIVENRV